MRVFIRIFLFCLFLVAGPYAPAQTRVTDSIRALVSKTTNESEKLRLLNALSDNEENPSHSISSANQAITLATKLGNQKELAYALNNMADAYSDKNLHSDAITYALRAYKIALENSDLENQSSALLTLGMSYYELGRYSDALGFLKEQLKLLSRLNSSQDALMCYNTIALIYFDQGNMNMAHKFYMKELEMAEKTNNKIYMAQSYNNLANIFDVQKRYDKALEYYIKDQKITQQLDNESNLATTYNNIGDVYLSLKEYKKAKENIEKAVEIAERLDNKEGLAIYYSSLATYYEAVGENEKALLYFKKDLANAMEVGNKFNLAESHLTLGDFFLNIKKLPEAEENYLSALKIAREIKALNHAGTAYKGLAQVKEKEGDYKNAFGYHVLYKMYYDSVFTQESEKSISELGARYESEKKEQTINLLNKERELKNNEIKKQKVIRYSFTIGFILMIGLVFMVFKSYRLKHKANELLAKQKDEIEIKNSELQQSKNELQKQKDLIDIKQKEILDSINYAKRIQYTLLANEEFLNKHLQNHFVIFKPKDIVSGDFYWATSVNPALNKDEAKLQDEDNQLFYLAVCDSTGHGVPGAFMSLLNIGFLSEAINEKGITNPAKVFDYVRARLIDNVSKESQKDGFDGVLLCIDRAKKKILYSAANIKGWMIYNGGLTELEADKMPVGAGEKRNGFTMFSLDYQEGATIYISTDGFADQFGGPASSMKGSLFGQGKKFKKKQLVEMLIRNSDKDLVTQQQLITNRFEEWKGGLEQVDDICMIGFRL